MRGGFLPASTGSGVTGAVGPDGDVVQPASKDKPAARQTPASQAGPVEGLRNVGRLPRMILICFIMAGL
jgi:hypothetical protein